MTQPSRGTKREDAGCMIGCSLPIILIGSVPIAMHVIRHDGNTLPTYALILPAILLLLGILMFCFGAYILITQPALRVQIDEPYEPESPMQDFGDALSKTLKAAREANSVPISLDPGEFYIKIVGSYFDATQVVEGQQIFGDSTKPEEVLAVMAYRNPDGSHAYRGKDSSGAEHDLDKVDKPAVLFVPKETLPLLQREARLWRRVKGSEDLNLRETVA
jgi:hypothetical protein